MVSWNLPARIAGRKAALDLSDSSQQENIQAAPCKKEAPNKGRRAHFNLNKSTVHAHYSLDDLTDEEFDSTWITAQEFMASKQDYVGIVRKMMKTIGPFPETDDCCIRGLEFKTKEGARRRKRTKQQACFAVLEEQDIQQEEGIIDPQFVADVYKEMTSQSSLEALNRGLKDQKAMLELLDEGDRLKWEQQKESKNSMLEVPLRRRSVTESLNGADMIQARRTVVA